MGAHGMTRPITALNPRRSSQRLAGRLSAKGADATQISDTSSAIAWPARMRERASASQECPKTFVSVTLQKPTWGPEHFRCLSCSSAAQNVPSYPVRMRRARGPQPEWGCTTRSESATLHQTDA